MGPLLVGAAGLMWGHVAVAGPGPGGGPGAVAPAALGDFGVDWGCLHNSRYYVAEF